MSSEPMELGEEISLEERQSLAKDTLNFVADVCREKSIPFYLLGGSALGAVRHGDMIPWDDDIDIGIPRNHYDALISSFPKHEYYSLFCVENTDGYVQPMAKVVDCRTYLRELGTKSFDGLGVFIDVFPLDYVPKDNSFINKALHMKRIYNYGFVVDWQSKEARELGILKRLFAMCSKVILGSNSCRSYANAITSLLRRGSSDSLLCFNLWGAWQEKELVPLEWFGEGISMPFGDAEYPIPSEYDLYLTQLYGDYMQPPSNPPHSHGKAWYRKTV